MPLPEILKEELHDMVRRSGELRRATGGGQHPWFYKVARKALEEFPGVEEDEVVEAIHAAADTFRRPPGYREIERTVSATFNGEEMPRMKPFHFDPLLVQRVQMTRVCDLVASSPVVPPGTAEEVLRALYAPEDLICSGWHYWKHDARLRDAALPHAERLGFLVPSPMIGEAALTKEKKSSARCRANALGGKYLVVEGDFELESESNKPADASRREWFTGLLAQGWTSKDICASMLLYLRKRRPLIMVVDTGGKSLHGWFKATPGTGLDDPFMEFAVALGADSKMRFPEQYARMPWGTRREKEAPYRILGRQPVIYFDPSAL